MAYGTAMMRTYYGAGDYNRGLAMAGNYYAAGGFFGKLAKGIKKVSKVVTKPLSMVSKVMNNPLISGVLSVVPGGSMLKTAVGFGTALTKTLSGGGTAGLGAAAKAMVSPKLLASAATGGLAETIKLAGGAIKRVKRTTKKRAPKRRAPKRAKRRYARGDYGDDWVGNRPSRAKGSGQFLTRAGGRRRKKARKARGRGGRVSFTTKDGRRVSFTPRGRRKRSARRRRPRSRGTSGSWDGGGRWTSRTSTGFGARRAGPVDDFLHGVEAVAKRVKERWGK